MKKTVVAISILAAAQGCLASDSAGLVGIMNTSDIVGVNNFLNPRNIWTLYIPDDPSAQADGGLTFSVCNTFEGKKEKSGEMYLPAKL